MTGEIPGPGSTSGVPGPRGSSALRGRHPLEMVSLRRQQERGDSHALERHVHDRHGRFSDDAQRLAGNPAIPASGGFLNATVAQEAVDKAVATLAPRIVGWRGAADVYTPFIAEIDLGRTVGSNLMRDEFQSGITDPTPTSGVRVVLMPNPAYSCGFAVLTAYNVRVPLPARRVFGISGLADYAAAGYGVIERSRRSPEAQIASGTRFVDWFLSDAVAARAIADGVAHWSGDIEAWLADADGPPTFTRAHVCESAIGGTIKVDDWQAGERRATLTPIVNFTLVRDARFADGFAVSQAFPSRGF